MKSLQNDRFSGRRFSPDFRDSMQEWPAIGRSVELEGPKPPTSWMRSRSAEQLNRSTCGEIVAEPVLER